MRHGNLSSVPGKHSPQPAVWRRGLGGAEGRAIECGLYPASAGPPCQTVRGTMTDKSRYVPFSLAPRYKSPSGTAGNRLRLAVQGICTCWQILGERLGHANSGGGNYSRGENQAISAGPKISGDKRKYLARGGFDQTTAAALEAEIRRLAAEVDAVVDRITSRGTYYNVSGSVVGPSGTALPVKLVWLQRLDGVFSFVTLVPQTGS